MESERVFLVAHMFYDCFRLTWVDTITFKEPIFQMGGSTTNWIHQNAPFKAPVFLQLATEPREDIQDVGYFEKRMILMVNPI